MLHSGRVFPHQVFESEFCVPMCDFAIVVLFSCHNNETIRLVCFLVKSLKYKNSYIVTHRLIIVVVVVALFGEPIIRMSKVVYRSMLLLFACVPSVRHIVHGKTILLNVLFGAFVEPSTSLPKNHSVISLRFRLSWSILIDLKHSSLYNILAGNLDMMLHGQT